MWGQSEEDVGCRAVCVFEFRDDRAVQLRRSSTFTSASFSLCITEKRPRGNASKISHFDESTRSISSITCANIASASLTAGFIRSAAAGVVTRVQSAQQLLNEQRRPD